MADLRAYVAGDDIRHLDRGSTARTGVPHVRTFREERDRALLLVADFRPPMLWGLRRAFRSVAAAEALAMIGWRAVEAGGRVGLLALSAGPPVIVPIRGRVRGMLAVIGGMVRAHAAALDLARSGARDAPPLLDGLTRVERVAPAGAEIVLASGFERTGPALQDRLRALGRRHALRLLAVTDGLTDRLPPGAYPIRLPDGTRHRARIGSGTLRPDAPGIAGLPLSTIDAGAAPEATAALPRRAMTEPAARALSEAAMLAGLQDIRLPAEAAGGLLAELLAAGGVGLAAAALLGGLALAITRRQARAPGTPDLAARAAALRHVPPGARVTGLLHLLKLTRPDRFAALAGDPYRRGAVPADPHTADRLEAALLHDA